MGRFDVVFTWLSRCEKRVRNEGLFVMLFLDFIPLFCVRSFVFTGYLLSGSGILSYCINGGDGSGGVSARVCDDFAYNALSEEGSLRWCRLGGIRFYVLERVVGCGVLRFVVV